MRSRTLERWQRIEIGRKSEEEEGFLVLGRGVIWESFQGDGKMEEFKELKRSGMTGKVTGGLSMIGRRLILSGPVELEEQFERTLRRTSGVIWRK